MKTGKLTGAIVSGLGLLGLITCGVSAKPDTKPLLKTGDHCVAYRVMKKMFYVSQVPVVGRNCAISAKVVPTAGRFKILVRVPISGFDSDNGRRDAEVARILGAPQKKALVFESRGYTREAIRKASAGDSFVITGRLRIGSRSHKLRLPIRLLNDGGSRAARGVLVTSFSDFDLKPPMVGPGGLIADTASKLELHFRVQLSRVENLK